MRDLRSVEITAMQMIIRKSSVRWMAGADGGARTVTTESGALKGTPLSAGYSRGRNAGTTAAELIAAAHAGSFSQALADELGKAVLGAGEILVSAAVTLKRLAAGWTIMNIHLSVIARLPRLPQGAFIDAAVRAKTSCVVSRALRPVVSMNARLEHLIRRRARQPAGADVPATRHSSSSRRTRGQ